MNRRAYLAELSETFAWCETLWACTWVTSCRRRRDQPAPVLPSCTANLRPASTDVKLWYFVGRILVATCAKRCWDVGLAMIRQLKMFDVLATTPSTTSSSSSSSSSSSTLVAAVTSFILWWVQWCSGRVSDSNREVAGLTHTRSTASNLENVANLMCAQANSAAYPQRNRKWVVATATGWRPSVADWGDGVSGLVVGRRTCDLVVAGSRPVRDAAA